MNPGLITLVLVWTALISAVETITFKAFIENETMLASKASDIEKFEVSSEKYIYQFSNIYFLQPMCDSIALDTATAYHKKDCLMTAVMNVLIIPIEKKMSVEYHFTLNQLIIDFNYTAMDFELEAREFKYSFVLDVSTVAYNKFLPIFSSSFSTEIKPVFDSRIPALLDESYRKKFEAGLKYATSSLPLFSTVFNLIELAGGRFFIDEQLDTETKHRVTYCYFTSPALFDFFLLENKEVPEKMKVNFDYSVNYDLNYKNGSFSIENIMFPKYHNLDGRIKYTDIISSFEPDNEEPNIKQKLMAEFKIVLLNSLEQYYLGSKVANSVK